MTDNICACISKLDFDNITDKTTAEKALMDCFSQQSNLLLDLADEKKINVTDQSAMRELGIGVGKNLIRENCQGYLKLSVIIAKGSEAGAAVTGTSEGRFKRIDTKEFNYFVLTDNTNNEKSFIWLRQFPGSENFTADVKKFTNNKLKIKWQEIEVYIPSAKNYYKIKEVVGIEVL
ncbi:hypothetical protein [Rufibacter aurantiacus]|uniref:hypothetical protein n=1 Tax=Rufibacter aurantiacus TaxID=2817374 RepID=UPI001B30F571|nr:hypothetical protein [Rufibacter aurantiacus]